MNDKDKDFNPNLKGVWLYIEYLQCKELTLREKVVLSIIYSLDNSKGCFATNEYFEDISNIKIRQISSIIAKLQEKNFITCEYDYSSKSRSPRTIKINPNKLTVNSHSQKRQGAIDENDNSHSQKQQGAIDKKGVYIDNIDYTKDYTKDKRELSHFDFLKDNYSNDYIKWKKENEKKIYDKRNFIEAFNDTMMKDSYPKSEKLLYRFKIFTRGYISRQKESDRPQSKPHYLTKIS